MFKGERNKWEVNSVEKNMINLKFGLFWSGAPLSYLRYLTFKSLRYFHPDAEIELYTTDKWGKDGYSWHSEKQDFERNSNIIDYRSNLEDINVKIKIYDKYPSMTPNFQSDMFRWDWLSNNSGFYLDTDQIILKSFEGLDRDYKLIYSGYNSKTCGYYTPVGVIGSDYADFSKWMIQLLPQLYNSNNYNSIGPFGFRAILQCYNGKEKMFNAPFDYFYPVPESYLMSYVYDNLFKVPPHSYAFHWFGGLSQSQEFNIRFTEEFAETSNDTISIILRNNNFFKIK
jgi:hypothetical protein